MKSIHWIIHIIFLIIVLITLVHKNRYKLILNDIMNPLFLILFSILSFISYWGIYINKDDNIKYATQRAISGFVIAYMAHNDFLFIAYIFMWIIVYHTGRIWV
jgi:hypothetical protein